MAKREGLSSSNQRQFVRVPNLFGVMYSRINLPLSLFSVRHHIARQFAATKALNRQFTPLNANIALGRKSLRDRIELQVKMIQDKIILTLIILTFGCGIDGLKNWRTFAYICGKKSLRSL